MEEGCEVLCSNDQLVCMYGWYSTFERGRLLARTVSCLCADLFQAQDRVSVGKGEAANMSGPQSSAKQLWHKQVDIVCGRAVFAVFKLDHAAPSLLVL